MEEVGIEAEKDSLFSLEASLGPLAWDRIKHAEANAKFYVPTERDEQLKNAIGRLLDGVVTRADRNVPLTRSNRKEGRALLVAGQSGTGKSRALSRLLTAHEALRPTDDPIAPRRPLISIKAPETFTPRAFYIRMLHAMGYPLVNSPVTELLIERVRKHAQRLQVLVLHIDDSSNSLVGHSPRARDRAVERVATTLRGLMVDAENPLSVIVSGLPSILDLVRVEEQFGRRAEIVHFNPLQANDADRLRQIGAKRAKTFGLADKETSGDFALRLLHAGNYQLGTVMEITSQAIGSALEKGQSRDRSAGLSAADFADVYFRRTACSSQLNVFTAADWSKIDTSQIVPRWIEERPISNRKHKGGAR